jgi:ankyrin repeat protein
MYAAQFDLVQTARLLLQHGADPSARTTQGSDRGGWAGLEEGVQIGERTPLMYAAENASPAMVRLLIQSGASKEETDDGKRTALDYLNRNRRILDDDRRALAALLR